MRFFDLHCDTITRCAREGMALRENDAHISLQGAQPLSAWCQCFAAFIPDEYRGEKAYRYFETLSDALFREAEKNSDRMMLCRTGEDIRTAAGKGLCGAILTVEGGAALGGSLSHVEDLLERGVRVLTLTWNGANELGSGILEEDDRGMTDFGRRAVHALTEGGCVMDVSHASEKLFWDLCETTSRPFIATHSDSKALCAAPRNLTDEQFAEIVRRGGLVGLNFCTAFLRDEAEKARTLDILRHADHFLSRGGEKVLAMGSDFDGCPLPPDMRGISSIPALYELFYKELKLSEETLDAIFYHNAFAFFTRH